MKTLVYYGPRQISIEEHEMPKAGPGEALIKVESVGICGSELEGYLGHSSVRIPPLIMGHEFCGTIVEVVGQSGHKSEWSVGDKVVVNPLISCGSSDRCIQGKQNLCRRRELIGIHRPGAFAEYVAVPLSNLYSVPKEMNASIASLAEPLAVCIHAVKLGLQPFEDVLIFGAGAIGLLTVQAAMRMGANRVLVVERQEARMHHAKALGADVVTPERLGNGANDCLPQGIDTIIDCVGVTATRRQALQWIQSGGKIIMVGLGHEESPVLMSRLVRQEVSI
ncbi:zinc-dependent alcohol dehydrogenase [Paenibacillus oceani]|uniref:Alcohol dehydrogenase catalytic domain-containing protein n=1 Tax=Paenibacillus oceani TaxID=2772510 RepID=A0A927H1M8_9BACL|nr:alcohol dehydrogenase catalytic domain-containing protein [Paenibacillus oceani]MBD2865336.1 alcohol dehydrogenase catalytic domain-containing protein [Paenibacillus oceani]